MVTALAVASASGAANGSDDTESIARTEVVALDNRTGEVRWRAAPDASDEKYEARIVARSMVIVEQGLCAHDEFPTRVVALDALTGAERWRTQRQLRVVGSLAHGGVVLAHPETVEPRLFALDLEHGSTLWEFRDMQLVGEAGDVVVVNRGRGIPVQPRVEGRDRRSGALLWTLDLPGPADAAGWQWVVGAAQGVTVVASVLRPLGADPDGTPHFSEQTTFVAVDTRSGDELWRRDFEPVLTQRRSGVAGAGVLAFVNRTEILGVDLRTGENRWSLSVDPSSTIEQTALYGPSSGSMLAQPKYVDTVSSIDLASGGVKWSDAARSLYEPYLSDALGPVALVGRHRSPDWTAAGLDAVDVQTGEPSWTTALDSERELWPVYGRNTLVLSSYCDDTI